MSASGRRDRVALWIFLAVVFGVFMTRSPETFASPQKFYGPEAFQMLPADTALFLYTPTALEFSEKTNAPQAAIFYDQFFSRLVAGSINKIARNAADAEALKKIGIDLAAPGGIAWIDPDGLTSTLFFEVNDEALFSQWMAALLQKPGLESEITTENNAQIFYLTEDFSYHSWIIRRGKHLFVLLSPHPREVGEPIARQLTKQRADRSLAVVEALREVSLRPMLAPGELLQGAFRFSPLLFSRVVQQELRLNALREGAAHGRPVTPELLDGLQALVGRGREALKGFRASPLIFSLRGSIGMGRAQLEAEQQGGRDDSMLHQVFKAPTFRRRFLKSLPRRVGGFAHASFDLDGLQAFLNLFIVNEDKLFTAALFEQLRAIPLMDVERDVLPLLTGEVGVAVVAQTVGRGFDAVAYWQSLDVAVAVGLRDPAGLSRLIEKLRTDYRVALVLLPHPTLGRYQLLLPMWKTLHVAIADDMLLISSDEAQLERLLQNQAGGFEAHLAKLGLNPWLDDLNPGLFMGLEPIAFTMPYVLRRTQRSQFPQPPTPPSPQPGSVDDPLALELLNEWRTDHERLKTARQTLDSLIEKLQTGYPDDEGFYIFGASTKPKMTMTFGEAPRDSSASCSTTRGQCNETSARHHAPCGRSRGCCIV